MEILNITPEMAAQMLAQNPENRPIKRKWVEKLARDMASGHWQVNGDAIRLNGDGSLIDGQHRLSACVESGVPFTSLVISGLPHDVRATIDGGVKRTYGDRLAMRNVPNSNLVASAVKMLAGIATGQLRYTSLTNAEMDMILAAHPGIIQSASHCRKFFPNTGTLMVSVHYIGTYLGKHDVADAFTNVWKTGVPTYPGDAAHFAREAFIRDQSAAPAAKMTLELRQRVFVFSWVKFAARAPMRTIRVPDVPSIPGWSRASLGI
jgi:hypothetical protein